jgi:hypothetical protein
MMMSFLNNNERMNIERMVNPREHNGEVMMGIIV